MITKKIAITGGIGSGKSTVLQYLKKMGYSVFSCDEISKQISQTPDYLQKIEQFFPETVKNGVIERKELARIVFQDENKRKILNNISHPIIMKTLLEEMSKIKQPVAFAEVPLLFEGNFECLFDEVIVVCRDTDTRLNAVITRDKLSEEEVKYRQQAQFDYDSAEGKTRIAACGAYLFHNNSSLQTLEEELKHFLSQII